MGNKIYESDRLLNEYLLFHYGTRQDILPWEGGPEAALDFPLRCAQLCLKESRRFGRALDLGCAVGRSSFELSAGFDEVTGIDFSGNFIAAAKRLQQQGHIECERLDEGVLTTRLTLQRPGNARPDKIKFLQGDACCLPENLGHFDCILLANLLCRLPDPAACLKKMATLTTAGARLVITTPCSWMEEYTPQSCWLGGVEREGRRRMTLGGVTESLEADFKLSRVQEMPFLIREHARKYQWTVSQASVWERL